eukprot:4502839-Amphidinium_carterae.1
MLTEESPTKSFRMEASQRQVAKAYATRPRILAEQSQALAAEVLSNPSQRLMESSRGAQSFEAKMLSQTVQ